MVAGPPSTHSQLPLFDRHKMNVLRQKQPLAYLLSVLRDGRWHTAKDLKVYGFNERQLGELVEISEGQILSFPGSPGYKSSELHTFSQWPSSTGSAFGRT